MAATYENIRTWHEAGFRLELFDTFTVDRLGKCRLAYELFDNEFGDAPQEPIFTGADFCASPMHSIDGDATVAALLSFLSLRPGDTDREYFDGYTDRHRDWCNARAEELSMLAMEIEDRAIADRD